ncbi:heavy metal translocating P-type ATPase [Pseudogracilibacillus auburnensis]|uniref:P-type Cu(+) transporter n=1 Tax=Pseudogracilibacillus auburnensis TaxID=1494959 RepID=A0A2V3W1Y3_9BACI|nr:heavy metal translocating P-type ATPase [Pseudogracilibacillus auburnensis]PXW87101.1 Cu+-exporting ATPase [Pseudogracilibacillus auburnensis]
MANETSFLHIEGMYCSNCANRIEKVVGKLDGVEEVTINLTTEKGKIIYDQQKTSITSVIKKINKIGFQAKLTPAKAQKNKELNVLKWNFICSAMLTFPLAWSMLAHFAWTTFIYIPPLVTNPFFQLFITIPIQFIIGFPFYERAWKAIKSGSANMDVLVVLSTSAAFFYSHYVTFTTPDFLFTTGSAVLFYETSAFIITFILLGRLLEAKTKSKTTVALEKLYHMQIKTATLIKNGEEMLTSVAQLVPGDIILIKPGEKVPIDGQVIEGYSLLDEALLTGESIPIEKRIGSFVYAGTINQQGVLKIIATKKESETILSNIINIVEEAQSSKAPIQQLADKITGVFVPIVIMVAIITFFGSYFLFDQGNVSGALSKVIAVLIIACPCALGLATPTSIMVGSGRAAQLGILFKEGKFLELLAKCNTILLDKTGTITSGILQVTNVYVDSLHYDRFMELVGAVERTSDHPVARAVCVKAKEEGVTFPVAQNVQNVPGYGIMAVVDGMDVKIASSSFYRKNKIDLPLKALQLEKAYKKAGKTVMIVFIDNKFAGVIALFDEMKSSSVTAVSQLKQMGLNVMLVTGDHHQAGVQIAKKIGIKEVYAECSPTEKATIVKRLQKKGNQVMMVGDGINDAPALAVADVGVAIGTGSDIAIESGDITMIKGNIYRLIDAIHISKRTMNNIKQNFGWAFIYNIIMIPFAMFGILVPWLAGAAMAFSSIAVVLNSLRLKHVKI